MEHIIFKHIMEHLETHNILADFQHDFREKRSCETQLIITPCGTPDLTLTDLDFSPSTKTFCSLVVYQDSSHPCILPLTPQWSNFPVLFKKGDR
jgi:hypothetical protein